MLCLVYREVVDSPESLFSCVQAFFLQHNSVLLNQFFLLLCVWHGIYAEVRRPLCGAAFLLESRDSVQVTGLVQVPVPAGQCLLARVLHFTCFFFLR